VERLKLQFNAGELLHYIGLEERDVSLRFEVNLAQKEISPHSQLLQIRPPARFYIASSEPPAAVKPNDIWNLDLSEYDQNQNVEVSFKERPVGTVGSHY
jgi:hypothetical protein